MKKFFTLCLLSIISTAVVAQSGPPWTAANFGYNYIFRAIDFPSNQSDIGFACGESLTYQGNGIVAKTTDGGATWTQMWMGAGRGVEGASFVDLTTGYIAGWPKLGQGWSGFAKTTDGGATWTSIPVTNDIYFFTDVVFKDANNGILVGQTNFGAGVWATSNGGTTWSLGTGIVAIPQHACHISGNTYFLVDNDGHIQKSTNNGLTWTTVWDAGGSLYMLGIDHYGDNTIMACGDYGMVVVSNDGGTTWTSQTIGDDIWHDFGWDSPDHVYVCGTPGLVFESWDGGATWQNANPPGAGQAALYECTFTEDLHGFICGGGGTELRRDPGCIAGFTAGSTATCTGDSLAFINESWGNISFYSWEFEGGTPATSTDPNPVVVYQTPGTYDVKLTVANPWWTDSMEKLNYITAAQSPSTPVISANGFTLTSNAASENQWYLNGAPIAGATGQTWEAVASGNYWDVVTAGSCSSDTSNNIYLVMTGIPSNGNNGLIISPVPNNGKFNITLRENASLNVCVDIYDRLGIRVLHQNSPAPAGGITVDMGNAPSGLYFVVVTEGSKRYSRSVIVE